MKTNDDLSEFEKFSDLNSFTVHLTRLYSYIFDSLRRKYPRCRFQSWVDCFALSSELEKRGDMSLKNAIAEIMQNEAGLTELEWERLKENRRVRNQVAHPSSSCIKAREAISKRWKNHSAFSALNKLIDASERISTPPRNARLKPIPTKNWRKRS